MLKKKKYAKWKREQENEEVDLKEVEKDTKPQLKKVERVSRFVRTTCQQRKPFAKSAKYLLIIRCIIDLKLSTSL